MKKTLLLILSIIPIILQAQMIWTGIGVTNKQEKYKFYSGVEERVYIPLKQKDFMVDMRFTSTIWKVMPVAGLSVWNHVDNGELRPYYGIDSKYFRLLMEHRLYNDKDPTSRLRARLSYKQKICSWYYLLVSEELFWAKEFDHNRLILGMQFKLKKLDFDLGYMSYHKDKNVNTLILKLNFNL